MKRSPLHAVGLWRIYTSSLAPDHGCESPNVVQRRPAQNLVTDQQKCFESRIGNNVSSMKGPPIRFHRRHTGRPRLRNSSRQWRCRNIACPERAVVSTRGRNPPGTARDAADDQCGAGGSPRADPTAHSHRRCRPGATKQSRHAILMAASAGGSKCSAQRAGVFWWIDRGFLPHQSPSTNARRPEADPLQTVVLAQLSAPRLRWQVRIRGGRARNVFAANFSHNATIRMRCWRRKSPISPTWRPAHRRSREGCC